MMVPAQERFTIARRHFQEDSLALAGFLKVVIQNLATLEAMMIQMATACVALPEEQPFEYRRLCRLSVDLRAHFIAPMIGLFVRT
jgi:hypothetical protein